MPADGTRLPVATNGDSGTSRLHGSSWTVAPSPHQFISGARGARKIVGANQQSMGGAYRQEVAGV